MVTGRLLCVPGAVLTQCDVLKANGRGVDSRHAYQSHAFVTWSKGRVLSSLTCNKIKTEMVEHPSVQPGDAKMSVMSVCLLASNGSLLCMFAISPSCSVGPTWLAARPVPLKYCMPP